MQHALIHKEPDWFSLCLLMQCIWPLGSLMICDGRRILSNVGVVSFLFSKPGELDQNHIPLPVHSMTDSFNHMFKPLLTLYQ